MTPIPKTAPSVESLRTLFSALDQRFQVLSSKQEKQNALLSECLKTQTANAKRLTELCDFCQSLRNENLTLREANQRLASETRTMTSHLARLSAISAKLSTRSNPKPPSPK